MLKDLWHDGSSLPSDRLSRWGGTGFVP
jgi:hypothetical protein